MTVVKKAHPQQPSAQAFGSGPIYLGVDVGGTKLLALAIDKQGQICHRERFPTGVKTAPEDLVELISKVVETLKKQGKWIGAMGIGFPGLVDREHGVVRSTIMLEGWKETPLIAMVRRRTAIPSYLDNDVNAAAIAELKLRKQDPRAQHSMFFVAVGTGVGGAVTLQGRLWAGSKHFAGEIGNIIIDPRGRPWRSGPRGTVNSLAAADGIEQRLGLRAGSLKQCLEQGHPEVLQKIYEGAQALGKGLASVAAILNPAIIVVGGGLARIGSDYLHHIQQGLENYAFAQCAENCAVELALAGYEAGALGAALLAKQKHEETAK